MGVFVNLSNETKEYTNPKFYVSQEIKQEIIVPDKIQDKLLKNIKYTISKKKEEMNKKINE